MSRQAFNAIGATVSSDCLTTSCAVATASVTDLSTYTLDVAQRARRASRELACISGAKKAAWLHLCAKRLREQMTELADPLRRTAESLLDDLLAAPTAPWAGRHIRLLGVRVGGLAPLARQLELFEC